MKAYLVAYGAAVIAFVVIDGIWLGLIARSFYASALGDLMRKQIMVAPAAAFYLLYAAGLVFLAVRPQQPELALVNIALYGGIVGFLAYGTYDMTNLSTIENWPATLSFVDLIWGTILSAAVAVIAALAVRQFS